MKRLKEHRDLESIRRFKEEHSKLFEVLTQKEVFWRPRVQKLWLQARDQNTRYYHACTNARKKNNQIHHIRNGEGVWIEEEYGLQNVMT